MSNIIREPEEIANLVANQKDVLFRLDFIHGYTYMSPSVINLLGVTPEDFYNDPKFYRKITHPDDLPKVEGMLKNVITNNNLPKIWELRQINQKTKEIVYEEYSFVVVKDFNGKPIAIEGLCRDVTPKKLLEIENEKYRKNLEELVEEKTKELQKTEKYLRSILEHTQDNIVHVDKDGIMLYANHAEYEGIDNIINKSIYDYIISDYRDSFQEALNYVYKERKSCKVEVVCKFTDSEQPIWYDTVITPLYNNGDTLGVIMLARNTTKEKVLDKELQQKNKKLRDAADSIGEAFLTMSRMLENNKE